MATANPTPKEKLLPHKVIATPHNLLPNQLEIGMEMEFTISENFKMLSNILKFCYDFKIW